MKNMKYQNRAREPGFIEERLMGLLASMLFSVPTAAILWLYINASLLSWDLFLGSSLFWGCMVFFMAVALFFPAMFPSMLGAIWRAIIYMQSWRRWWI